METVVSIALGIGLSAAVGFRVFIPLLIISIASMTGYLNLSSGFEWIGTFPALIAFGTATVIEVLAYFIPWVDNLLDTVSSPLAVTAGIQASASVITDVPPLLKWTAAIILGGGIAGLVQGATVLTRAKSTALTAGTGNFLVSASELFGSVVTSILALLVPVLCVFLILTGIYVVFKTSRRILFGRGRA